MMLETIKLPPLSYDQKQLVASNVKLPRMVVGRCIRRNRSIADMYDDLLQDGYLGLIVAALRYRTDRGASFKTYAYPWITNFVQEGIGRVVNPMRAYGSTGEVHKQVWVKRADMPLDHMPGALAAPKVDAEAAIDAQRVARALRTELESVPPPPRSADQRQRNAALFLELKSGEAAGAAERHGLTRGRTQQIRTQLQPVYDKFCRRMQSEADDDAFCARLQSEAA